MHKKERNKKGIIVSFIGIFLNFILGLIKIILSFKTHSISILTDAVNNLTDMTSSIITMIGFKLSSKKPNKKHPFGYARYEYIAGFIISSIMLVMSVTFVIKSINKIINPEKLIINNLTFIILFITLIVKILQMILYKKSSIKLKSSSLKAASIETRNDVITNASILISMFIMKIYNINIDGYIGLIVSIILVYSSIKTLKEMMDFLVGIKPSDEKIKYIKDKILSFKEIKEITNIKIHNYGINVDYVTINIKAYSNKKLIKLISLIKEEFEKENIDITIQIDKLLKRPN